MEPLKQFKLTACQEAGLFKMTMSTDHHIIIGPAGTGKTTLLRKLVDSFQNTRIVYCAPTHAAKEVLQETLNVEAYTIHSILGIHPDTYEDEMKFQQGSIPDLSEVDILVVDEASMLDGELFTILMNSVHMGCRIIALGDPYQIQPVRNDPGIISPIFFDKRFSRIVLLEIVRQGKDSPIIQVATDIRKKGSPIYELLDDDGYGVKRHSNLSSFFSEYFKYVKTPEDTLKYKMLAYTNDSVDQMNGIVRQRIYNTTEPFISGEYLVMQEPVYKKMKCKGMEVTEPVYHNGETIKIVENSDGVDAVRIDTMVVKLPKTEHLDPIEIEFYKLSTRNMKGDVTYTLNVVYNESHLAELETYMHYAAMHYKRLLRTGTPKWKLRESWDAFWELKDKFKRVKSSAACTFHKSQGSTFDGVFINTYGMGYADPNIRRQLCYVGVTRARKFVHFI